MDRKPTKDKKYPLTVILDTGEKIYIPHQSHFTQAMRPSRSLKHNGCSLMAEYMALNYLGVYKYTPYQLFRWHDKNTPNMIPNKVRIKALSAGINALAKGKGTAKYYATVTKERVRTALEDNALIIVEWGPPERNIHSVVYVASKKATFGYLLNSAGGNRCTKMDLEDAVNQAYKYACTKNSSHKGMVVVKHAESTKKGQ